MTKVGVHLEKKRIPLSISKLTLNLKLEVEQSAVVRIKDKRHPPQAPHASDGPIRLSDRHRTQNPNFPKIFLRHKSATLPQSD